MQSQEMLQKQAELGAETVVEARPFAARTVITPDGAMYHLKQSVIDRFGNIKFGPLHIEKITEKDLKELYPNGAYCGCSREGRRPVTPEMRNGYTLSAVDFA